MQILKSVLQGGAGGESEDSDGRDQGFAKAGEKSSLCLTFTFQGEWFEVAG